MRLVDFPAYLRDTALRMLPHRAPTGLVRIGKPDRTAPVLVTGNFTLTVRRLRDALRGHDAWLLVANSQGINVWCAAGGGHLTHHDVISVIRTSGIAELVDRKEVILPQLCATGVERRRITESTGFETRWGPARLEDLPAFLTRGARVGKRERFMRFPLWERMEMAAGWAVPMVALAVPIVWLVGGFAPAVVSGSALALMVLALFALLPWLELRTRARYLTFTAFFVATALLGVGALFVIGSHATGHVLAVALTCFLGMALLSIDLAGSTPWYASYVVSALGRNPHIELIEDRCTGAADCVKVCPRDVFEMNGRRRQVEIRHRDQCVACGACIVQCPEDALHFRYDDGRVVEPATVRRTRLNMMGQRTLEVQR